MGRLRFFQFQILFCLVGLLIAGASAKASSSFSCEQSHLQVIDAKQIDRMAGNLVKFRMSIYSTNNQESKRQADHEFNVKFGEFSSIVGSKDEALKLFQDKMQAASRNGKASLAKDEESKAHQKKKDENDHLVGWEKFRTFENFFEGKIVSSLVTPDGTKLIVIGQGTGVKILDLTTQQEVPLAYQQTDFMIYDLSVSSDSSKLVTGGSTGIARMMDLKKGIEIPIPYKHSDYITQSEITPDGSMLITADGKGEIKAMDLNTHQEISIPKLHRKSIRDLIVSPDSSPVQ